MERKLRRLKRQNKGSRNRKNRVNNIDKKAQEIEKKEESGKGKKWYQVWKKICEAKEEERKQELRRYWFCKRRGIPYKRKQGSGSFNSTHSSIRIQKGTITFGRFSK